MSLILILSSH